MIAKKDTSFAGGSWHSFLEKSDLYPVVTIKKKPNLSNHAFGQLIQNMPIFHTIVANKYPNLTKAKVSSGKDLCDLRAHEIM